MLKDSGDRREFESGAVRDMSEGKGRCDLLPAAALLRISQYRANARRLNDNVSFCSMLDDSLIRLMFYLDGETNHDHLCAAACDLIDAMYMEEKKSIDIPKYSSYPACALLRLSKHYEAGAVKYAPRNWEKGLPISSFIDSGIRHLLKCVDGQTDEDRLVAAAWNIMCAMWMEEKHPELQDIPSRSKPERSLFNFDLRKGIIKKNNDILMREENLNGEESNQKTLKMLDGVDKHVSNLKSMLGEIETNRKYGGMSINLIKLIEDKYGPIPSDDKIQWIRENMGDVYLINPITSEKVRKLD